MCPNRIPTVTNEFRCHVSNLLILTDSLCAVLECPIIPRSDSPTPRQIFHRHESLYDFTMSLHDLTMPLYTVLPSTEHLRDVACKAAPLLKDKTKLTLEAHSITDGSSCGAMVARNAVMRIKGGMVDNWEDKLDEVAVRKYLVDRFRNAVGKGLQKADPTHSDI